MGGFEDYLEQPVLSPRAKETMPAQNIAEKGKMRTEEQESNTSEQFYLLIEMREEIKRIDKQLKEELRWRDENLVAKNKVKEENLAALLQ